MNVEAKPIIIILLYASLGIYVVCLIFVMRHRHSISLHLNSLSEEEIGFLSYEPYLLTQLCF